MRVLPNATMRRLMVPLALASLGLAASRGRSDQPTQVSEPTSAEKSSPRSAKQDLTPDNFARLHSLIRPHDREWRHLRVQWLTDVVAARKKAAAEDKPIVICYTGGAGYNEPLGVC
jgi:hypothetical protein